MNNRLKDIANLIRYYILTSTTEAGSGHPTSSLSATDLMTSLFFDGFFRYFIEKPTHPNNDRIIFSKGHAAPLLYALWATAGAIYPNKLHTLRQFGSSLEGHPTPRFKYTEGATGSLGQGLSIGVGMALNAKYLDKLDYKTFVLLGDGEMAEGSIWEAAAIASHYKLNNLTAILDVNRLGQSGSTMHEWSLKYYQDKLSSFGWQTILVDGHDFKQTSTAFTLSLKSKDKPTAIIAKTVKGKGISFIENKQGWHGKALNGEELQKALKELGEIKKDITHPLRKPTDKKPKKTTISKKNIILSYKKGESIATRKAYGNALVRLGQQKPAIVVMDGETKNSTYAEKFQLQFPQRFFEMFIAEQNMVGVALGMSLRGKSPFISTFAAFWTRAFDQIRMSQYSIANITFVGSHAGVSIGPDGSSQMGLEDISMFSSLLKSVVLYPCDAVATEKLADLAAEQAGIVYLRTTRQDTPVIYDKNDYFKVGGSKILKESKKDSVTVVAAGITLYEALKAYEKLKAQNIFIRVIDCYSIKPIDKKTLLKAHKETKAILTVEDHYPHGGLGAAVNDSLAEIKQRKPLYKLAVTKIPMSGKSEELLAYEQINWSAIVRQVKQIV